MNEANLRKVADKKGEKNGNEQPNINAEQVVQFVDRQRDHHRVVGYVVLQAGVVLEAFFAAFLGQFDVEKVREIRKELLDQAVLDQTGEISFEEAALLSPEAFPDYERSKTLEHLETGLGVGVPLQDRLSDPGDEIRRDVRNDREDPAEVPSEHVAHAIVGHKEAGIRSVDLRGDLVD